MNTVYARWQGLENRLEDAEKIKQAMPGITDSDLKDWASKHLDALNKHAVETEALSK